MPMPCFYSNQSWKDQKGPFFGCQVPCVMTVKQTWLTFPQNEPIIPVFSLYSPSTSSCNPMWTYIAHFESTTTILQSDKLYLISPKQPWLCFNSLKSFPLILLAALQPEIKCFPLWFCSCQSVDHVEKCCYCLQTNLKRWNNDPHHKADHPVWSTRHNHRAECAARFGFDEGNLDKLTMYTN